MNLLHFRYRERQPEKFYPKLSRAIVGVCTGSLAAIAATIARSDADFLNLAFEFVLLALRIGIEVSRRSCSIETSSEPWSVAIMKSNLDDTSVAIETFNRSQALPVHKTVFIGAQSEAGLTLTGPPSVLNRFLEETVCMKVLQKRTLPIYGLFHAPHLPLPDLPTILGVSDLWNRQTAPAVQSSLILSSCNLSNAGDNTLRELLSVVITDILRQPLDLNLIVQRTQSQARGHAVRFVSIGPAHTGLFKRSLPVVETERFGSPKLPSADQVSTKHDYRDAIAVVGMACRTPGAQNVDELWELFLEGRDMHRQVPPDRFDIKTHYDPTGKVPNTTISQWGCFDDHVAEFDLALFKMSPREALQTDPCHRMMLITGYEALESAGYYDPGGPRPKFGTFYGQAGDDYRQVNSGQNIDTNYITGGIRAFAPGRVSYYFGWEGPSMNIDTACSSSAVAINQACSSLRLGESDMALAGGVNLLTSSDFFAGLSRAKFISTTGPCKTLDETADGYCRADGAGSVVLKRYEDAFRDNDNIIGIIRSIETGHAGTAISITHPEPDTQIAVFQNILSRVGMDARDIDHVEMHGTGTQAGDMAETESIFGLVQAAGGPRPEGRPLTIASVKPNIGHSEGASGVTSLIKALLMMKHHVNPHHIGIKTRLNPKLPHLASLGIVPPLSNAPYMPTSDKRRIVVNNFNATGGITAILVEEHISNRLTSKDLRGDYPIVLSAANQKTLLKSMTQLQAHMKTQHGINLSHLSYTLTARRLHHNYGFACVVNSIDELTRELENSISSQNLSRVNKRGSLASTVFVFTGQAVSYMGMAKVLFKTNDVFRSHLTRSDALCQTMGLPSFLEIIDNDSDNNNLSGISPTKTHLALVALEIALAYLFDSWGIQPTAVLGHSLGEYSALCVSQALSLADTLYLVGKRAQLMEVLCRPYEYSMVATSLSPKEAQSYVSMFPEIRVSCLNGPSQTVLSGRKAAVDECVVYLELQKVKVKRLSVEYAFHSAQMDVLLPEYERIATGVSFREPIIPLISTHLGRATHADDLTADYLCQQTRQPVNFMQAVETISLAGKGDSVLWIELGPAPACSHLINLITNTTNTVAALDPRKPNWRTISSVMAKHYMSRGNVAWNEFHMQYLDSLRLIKTPSYPFDMTRHWMQYEGDWSITKNRGSSQTNCPPPSPIALSSSTLQWLHNVADSQGMRTLVFGSDLKLVRSIDLVYYFEVDGSSSTTSAVYLDMSMTAAKELWNRSDRKIPCPGLEVTAFEFLETSLPSEDVDRYIRITATERASDQSTVDIIIVSNAKDNSSEVECRLAKCKVVFGDTNEWTTEAETTAFLYQSRMDLLEMVSRTIPGLSKETTSVKNIQSLSLALGSLEAVARITFQASQGQYACAPQFSDAVLHLPRLLFAKEDTLHPVTSWQRIRILRPVIPDTQYRCHVRTYAQTTNPHSMTATIQVFDLQDRLVAEFRNIQYQPISSTDKKESPSQENMSRPTVVCLDIQGTTMVNSISNSPTQPEINMPTQLKSTPLASIPPIASLMQSPLKHTDSSAQEKSHINIPLILELLASELGVPLDSTTEHEPFEDMGVDSIMSMTLLAKMQELVAMKLPGSLLIERNSFAKLREFFLDSQGA
jgi:acyl transferase domain-containing protein/acyl carrier protein